MKNRSVPADVILPHVTYQDVGAAVEWLGRVFGFEEHYRYGAPDGPVEGAQVHLGDAWIMLNRARPGRCSPAQAGCGTQSLTVFVDDVDAHFERAKAAGACVVEDRHETVYGEWQYGVEDAEGHRWLFSRHVRDVSPDEWARPSVVSDGQRDRSFVVEKPSTVGTMTTSPPQLSTSSAPTTAPAE